MSPNAEASLSDDRSARAKGDSNPATSLVTWALALVFLVAIDASITRTSILWGPTAFENSGGIRTVFPQTYQALRQIYHPERDAAKRVVLLGNSRLSLAVRGDGLQSKLNELASDSDIDVSNLAIFGSYTGDTAALVRHLDVLDPTLVVIALGGPELARTPTNPDAAGPASLLKIGWQAGPSAAKSVGDQLDRWPRTVWPLYRFREFTREALLDRILGRPDPGPPPSEFASELDLFRHLYGDRAPVVAAARESFLEARSLASFTDFVTTVGPDHLARQRKRVRDTLPITSATPSVLVLDEMLADLAADGRNTLVLIFPENPIMDLDEKNELHRPAIMAQGADLIYKLGARNGVRVVDGRRWLPAECFLDFHHPIFDMSRFEDQLAAEILDALDS